MRTERTEALPPFFTQVIGSLPRPKLVLNLHENRHAIAHARFNQLMDEMVIFAIRLQEQAGLDVVSDGEWRRLHYVDEFLYRIGGFEKIRPFEHAGEQKFHMVVTDKMSATESVFAKDAEFLVRHTDRIRKFALPSPFLIAIRYWHEDYSTGPYPSRTDFMSHLAQILRNEAIALEAIGIDIIQLDDPAITYFCDRELMGAGNTHDDRLKQQWDITTQMPEAIDFINSIFEGLKAELHLHCCHSVYKRNSDVAGNHEPILPYLKDAKIDRINLEFAYHGTGDTSDLELLPDGLNVGMGVLDVRNETLQEVDEIVKIGTGGGDVISPDRIALNPDCGFAPDMGEPPSIDEAFEKLSRLCQASKILQERL